MFNVVILHVTLIPVTICIYTKISWILTILVGILGILRILVRILTILVGIHNFFYENLITPKYFPPKFDRIFVSQCYPNYNKMPNINVHIVTDIKGKKRIL